jgi:hypothetical protein
MIFNQVEHLVKMTNDLQSYVTWFTTLGIYLLFTHPPIYLWVVIYLPITHPPTYYLPTHLPTYYIC